MYFIHQIYYILLLFPGNACHNFKVRMSNLLQEKGTETVWYQWMHAVIRDKGFSNIY